jgi:glycosyltransferase 2 family protein
MFPLTFAKLDVCHICVISFRATIGYPCSVSPPRRSDSTPLLYQGPGMRFLSPKVIIISGLQIALTGILLVALVRLLDPTKLRQLLHAVDPAWFTLSFVILIIQQMLAAERWRLVGRALLVPPHTFSFYLFWQGLGMLCSMVLPSMIGADLTRTYALSRRAPIGMVLRIVLIDRALGLLALASLVVIALLVLPLFFIAHPLLLVPVAIAVCGVVIYLVLTRWLSAIKGTSKLTLASRQLGSDLRRTVEGDGSSRVILTSLSIHVLSVLAFFSLGIAIGMPDVDLIHYLAIVSCGLLVTIIPISVGGWGIRESALVIGFGLLSVEPERAFALSATFGLLAMLSAGVASLVGLQFFVQKPIDDLAEVPSSNLERF